MAVSTNDNTKAFTDAIRKMAAEECRQIDSQTKLLRSQRLTEMKKEIRRQYDIKIDYELSKIRMDVNRRLAECSEGSRKELAELRAQLTDKVFDSVLKRIDGFVASDAYIDLLCGSIKAIREQSGDSDIEFMLCGRDLPLAEKINERLGESIGFKADDGILIGGVRAFIRKTQTLIDDTLDERIQAQKEWFYKNSELKV